MDFLAYIKGKGKKCQTPVLLLSSPDSSENKTNQANLKKGNEYRSDRCQSDIYISSPFSLPVIIPHRRQRSRTMHSSFRKLMPRISNSTSKKKKMQNE